MKKFFTFIMILSAAAFMNAQILNAGFENWTPPNPDNWWTNNLPPFWTVVSQSSTAHGGSSSAKAEVFVYNNDPVGGAIFSGSGLEGFTVSSKVRTLKGWYQLNSVGGDMIMILAVLYNADNMIGAGEIDIANSTSGWQQFIDNIEYFDPNSTVIPDKIMLEFILAENNDSSDVHLGSWFLIDDLELSDIAVSVNDGNLVNTFNLNQNYPNPFNPSTKITYSIPSESYVTLKVYDVLGKEVTSLVNETQSAGAHSVDFNAANLSNGIYFYELKSGSMSSIKKMMLVK